MSKIDKIIKKILNKPKDFTWDEMVLLLTHLGFQCLTGNGSRKKFIKGKFLIILNEPHPQNTILACYIKQVVNTLKKEGLI